MSKCHHQVGSKVITRTDPHGEHPLTVEEAEDKPALESRHTITARYDHADYVRVLGCNSFRAYEEKA